jgi:hypothetical protein
MSKTSQISTRERRLLGCFEKSNKYKKEGYQKKELNLHFHQYCTCEELEELICNKIAK